MRRLLFILAGLAVALGAAAPSARADKLPARVVVTSCTHGATASERVAVFEGQISTVRKAAKMQMRFTLQTSDPADGRWRPVGAVGGFGVWITAPVGLTRYLYDKTVRDLLAPGAYRAVVQFRWRDANGHTIRSEHATSRACEQPDPRPDLAISSLKVAAPAGLAPDQRRYVAVVANHGRGDAGPFTVDFTRNGELLGTVSVPALAARTTATVALPAPACATGDAIAAVADAREQVDEVDETDNALVVTC
jgi:hypothetical protein